MVAQPAMSKATMTIDVLRKMLVLMTYFLSDLNKCGAIALR